MDLPAARADEVLAQPTRARLFALLGDLRRPAATEELAERLGLHPNGVRTHLERLTGAGLVARTRVRRPVGRPRDEWTIAPDAQPGGAAPHAYAQLGPWLARAIPASAHRLREVETTGRQIGRELAPRDADAPAEEALHATLAALGFRPRREVAGDGTLRYRLGNCPYRDAVHENQPVVCTLHRGMTHGLLDVLAPRATLTDFVARDPDAAGCVIEVARGPAGPRGRSEAGSES